MTREFINWEELNSLASKLSGSDIGPGGILDVEWKILEQSLNVLIEENDLRGILILRDTFEFLIKGETVGGLPIIQNINDVAIRVAEELQEYKLVARFLHDNGENYHRKGYHKESIQAFERSAILYDQEGEDRKSLESYYFSALAYRALGNTKHALSILRNVLSKIGHEDPWQANPLEVMSWILRDEEKYDEAEKMLNKALKLYKKLEGPENIHVVQTLADLGEVVGLQGRFSEADTLFNESLEMINKFGGQYDRQVSRTKVKYSEMLINQKKFEEALILLDQADDKIRGYGHYYDLLMQIELARSFAFFGLGSWRSATCKMRIAFQYWNEIGRPIKELIKFILRRLRRQRLAKK